MNNPNSQIEMMKANLDKIRREFKRRQLDFNTRMSQPHCMPHSQLMEKRNGRPDVDIRDQKQEKPI